MSFSMSEGSLADDEAEYTCTAFDNLERREEVCLGGTKEEVSSCCNQMMDNIGLHDSCQGPKIAEVASEQVNSLGH